MYGCSRGPIKGIVRWQRDVKREDLVEVIIFFQEQRGSHANTLETTFSVDVETSVAGELLWLQPSRGHLALQ